MKKRGIGISLLALAALALLGGLALYFFFRNRNLLLFQWFGTPVFVREQPVQDVSGQWLATVLVYNIPDGLWLLSGILFIRAFWITDRRMSDVYTLVFCALGFTLELLQLHERLPGIFDVWDMLCMAIAAFGERVAFNFFIKEFFYAE
jgi:hypothetical protein